MPALEARDAILDQMLSLAEYAPGTLKCQALNIYMMNQGQFFSEKQEIDMPSRLRQAQAKVLEMLEK